MSQWDKLLGGSSDSFDNARESISIADCRHPDMPLVYVGKGFEKISGYQRAEVVGKNCRFLQGPATQNTAVEEMRRSIKMSTSCLVEFINYRKNGEKFENRLSLTPVFDKKRQLIFYIGLQNDVSQMKEFEQRLLGYIEKLNL